MLNQQLSKIETTEKMKKIISIFLTTAFLFQSCENKTDKKLNKFVLKKDSISLNKTEIKIHSSKENVKYSLKVEKIDSIQ